MEYASSMLGDNEAKEKVLLLANSEGEHQVLATPLCLPDRDHVLRVKHVADPLKMFEYNKEAILKIERPGWELVFSREAATFQALYEYQGRYLPHFYGIVTVKGFRNAEVRATLLSYQGGQLVGKIINPPIPKNELAAKLEEALQATVEKRIMNTDIDWKNAMLVNGRIQFIDWFDTCPSGDRNPDVTEEQDMKDYVWAETRGFLRWHSAHLEYHGVDFKAYGYEKF